MWSRLHTVAGTAANVHDFVKADALLHGKETVVYGDAGYRGIQKRTKAKAVQWMVSMCPGKRAALDRSDALDRIFNEIEYLRVQKGAPSSCGLPAPLTRIFAQLLII